MKNGLSSLNERNDTFFSFVLFKNLSFPFLIFQTLDTTWTYDVVSKTWSEGPKMNTIRESHSCFADHLTSSIYIAGGHALEGLARKRLNSTEKWTLEENSWKPSADLPEAIFYSSAVSSNTDQFLGYMAGGAEGVRNIYGLRRRQMEWIKLNKTIKTGRYAHSLLNIPANQILGC